MTEYLEFQWLGKGGLICLKPHYQLKILDEGKFCLMKFHQDSGGYDEFTHTSLDRMIEILNKIEITTNLDLFKSELKRIMIAKRI